MPHYPGHEHGHQYEYLYGDDYDWGNMTSTEIGEAYYNTGGYMSNPIDDYWDNAGQYNINFWEELLSPYLNWTYMGGGSHGGAAGTEYSGAINFDNWWQDYGAYLPTDNILGHSSIMRTHRMADLEEENLQRDFGSQRSQLESQYGSTGFTGSGLVLFMPKFFNCVSDLGLGFNVPGPLPADVFKLVVTFFFLPAAFTPST